MRRGLLVSAGRTPAVTPEPCRRGDLRESWAQPARRSSVGEAGEDRDLTPTADPAGEMSSLDRSMTAATADLCDHVAADQKVRGQSHNFFLYLI